MILSRIVPSHSKTLTISHLKCDFMPMSDEYRRIRSGSKNPMTSCFWCGYNFVNGDMMGLAICVGGNKVLCQECCKKVENK